MTTATTESAIDADGYLKQVAPYLAALPEEERTELLDDLAQHLQEIAAEPGPPLRERLGPPEDYAAELLSSAGVAPQPRVRRGVWATGASMARRLRGTALGAEVVRLQPVLRPAWWVARAVLAVALVATIQRGGSYPGFPVPELFGSSVLGMAAILAAIPLSVRLGQRELSRTGRLAVLATNGILVVFAIALVDRAGTPTVNYVNYPQSPGYSPGDGCLRTAGGHAITNLYAYDLDGRLLDPVLLYDDEGRPVDNLCPEFDDQGRRLFTEYRQDVNGAPVINAFPRRQTASAVEPNLNEWRAPTISSPAVPVPVRPPAVVVPRLAPTTTAAPVPTTNVPAGAGGGGR